MRLTTAALGAESEAGLLGFPSLHILEATSQTGNSWAACHSADMVAGHSPASL